jgi:hypothetical protein
MRYELCEDAQRLAEREEQPDLRRPLLRGMWSAQNAQNAFVDAVLIP